MSTVFGYFFTFIYFFNFWNCFNYFNIKRQYPYRYCLSNISAFIGFPK